MATVHDIAHYILKQKGSMTAMKLQKLVYYSQAWALVWDDAPLFEEEIQAWANGPVVPELYQRHRGMFMLNLKKDIKPHLDENQRDTVDKVLDFYAPMTSQQLSDLTHSERPWLDARAGLADGERGERVISLASMAEFYSSL